MSKKSNLENILPLFSHKYNKTLETQKDPTQRSINALIFKPISLEKCGALPIS